IRRGTQMGKKSDLPAAPSHLKGPGRKLWTTINTDYELEGADLSVLDVACVHFDRAAAARETIDAEGAIVKDRFGQQKPHPACEIEQASSRLYLAALRQLGLGLPASPDSMRLAQPIGKNERD